jgi:hypothetical protein
MTLKYLLFQASNTLDPSREHTAPTAGLSRGVYGYASHGSNPFSFQHVSQDRGYVGNLPPRDYPQSKVSKLNFTITIYRYGFTPYYSFRFLLSLQAAVPLDNLVPGHNLTDYVQ